ncbi:hypothetical protein HMPREF9080_02509 [Cardiobacterium valvarum F0432]|uniref:Uncharacterized protein n=1 Tax=Cardiobacterium valvarum F0432 TaxID=797473 RepID=G9ZI99_9GAMM|nr:hypothetical protein HMPREF9080_02509 [Cardiobacterium valvarum F0432]
MPGLPPSEVNARFSFRPSATFPRKRGGCWVCHQAAKILGSSSGIDIGFMANEVNAGFLFPPSGLRPPSPASGGRDFFRNA